MQNIRHDVKGNILHIEVDLSKEIGLSVSANSATGPGSTRPAAR